MTTFSDQELDDFIQGKMADVQEYADSLDTPVEMEVVVEKSNGNVMMGKNKSMWVPIIFLIVYFILIAMLWANNDWFKRMNFKISAGWLSFIWLLVFIGIVVTWVQCLKNSSTKNAVGWISFWFILNLVLLLVAGWAFFVTKNVALASFVMFFLWISTISLIAVAAKHWGPGVAFMLLYLGVITWMWYVIAKQGYKMVSERAGKFVGVMMASGNNASRLTGLKNLFKMDQKADGKADGKAVDEPRTAPAPASAPVAVGPPRRVDDELASEAFETPRGTWRDRFGQDE